MLVFLELNNIQLTYTDAELVAVGLALADGKMDVPQLLAWIIAHD